MTISKLTHPTAEALKDINTLLLELRGNSGSKATMIHLKDITNDPKVVCVVAKDGKKIIGMATLYIMQKFGKRIAHVEDVVVDSAYRGQGLGEKIMREVIMHAKKKKVGTLSLTSRPARVAANKLYQKLGFERKETNPYRMGLK